MGAFNILKSMQKCNTCGGQSEFFIQFKYGMVWQYEYKEGDELIWGKVNIGDPGYKRVVVDGCGDPCPLCGESEQDFEIWIEKGKIMEAKPVTGEYDLTYADKTYIIVEE
jgi:hypothetical protein